MSNSQASTAENKLFDQWQQTRNEYDMQRLVKALRTHASKIIWLKLHLYDPSLTNAAVFRALHNISTFRGDSKFSSWFHRVATNVVNDEMRELQVRKGEVPLDEVTEPVAAEQDDSKVLYAQVRASLDEDGQVLMDMKRDGYADAEIAQVLNVSLKAAQDRWRYLKVKLRVAFPEEVKRYASVAVQEQSTGLAASAVAGA